MVYADSDVGQDGYSRFYANFSKYGSDRENYAPPGQLLAESGAPWDRVRLQESARIIAHAVENKRARVVDIGCANGTLLVYLSRLGFSDLLGIDPSPVCAANTAANAGIDGMAGSLGGLPPELGAVDVAVLAHVLEHVWDLDGAMRALRQLVVQGGLVYVEVPDASRYGEHLVAPFHDFNTEHINHFSPLTLQSLLARWGFEPVETAAWTVPCSPDARYPVTGGVWRRASGGPDEVVADLTVDATLAERIQAYATDSAELMREFDQQLESALGACEEVVVWGVGELTMKLLREPALARRRLAALVDSSEVKQGLYMQGTEVIGPEQLHSGSSPIVVGSVHHCASIVEAIRGRYGLENPIVTLRSPGSRP